MTREQFLADAARSFHKDYPERADEMMRMAEAIPTILGNDETEVLAYRLPIPQKWLLNVKKVLASIVITGMEFVPGVGYDLALTMRRHHPDHHGDVFTIDNFIQDQPAFRSLLARLEEIRGMSATVGYDGGHTGIEVAVEAALIDARSLATIGVNQGIPQTVIQYCASCRHAFGEHIPDSIGCRGRVYDDGTCGCDHFIMPSAGTVGHGG